MVTPTFFTWLANLISVSLCKTDVLVVLACASVGVLVGLADEQILVTPWYKCQVAAVYGNAHVFYLACKFNFCVAV